MMRCREILRDTWATPDVDNVSLPRTVAPEGVAPNAYRTREAVDMDERYAIRDSNPEPSD